jgi:ribosomal protein L11 methyltransferase
MTRQLDLKLKGSDVEKVSDAIWAQWADVEGIQEAPLAGQGLFAMAPDFEVLEFGSEAAKKAAQWLESDSFRGEEYMRVLVFLRGESNSLVDDDLKKRVSSLGESLNLELEWLSIRTLADTDYLEEYRKNVKGTFLANDLWVGPPWDRPSSLASSHCYIIEPGLAFGTGDHPTTQLMLSRLREYSLENRKFLSVLDLGCGTGVLGLAAKRYFSPSQLYLTDLDPYCGEEVQKLFRLNEVSSSEALQIQCRFGATGTAEALARDDLQFDLIISNIYAEVLASLAPAIVKILKPGGIWLCSGILEGKSESVLDEKVDRLFDRGLRRTQSKQIPLLDSYSGMQVQSETWVLREYLRSEK